MSKRRRDRELDEIAVLRAIRPEARPSEEVVARHRAELRRTLDGPTASWVTPIGEGPEPTLALDAERLGHRRRRPAIAASVAAALVVVAGVAVALRPGGDSSRVATEEQATSSSVAAATPDTPAAPAFACGPALPVELPLPAGFAGPTAGPSGDAFTQPGREQLAVHWVSATGSIEVRWPGDSDPSRQLVDDGAGPGAGVGIAIAGEPRTVASGRLAVTMDISGAPLSAAPACQTMSIVVADADPQRARQVGSELLARLTEPGGPAGGPVTALVASSTTADTAPEVPPCRAPDGVPHSDRVGGPVDIGTHLTAEAALQAFIDSKRVPDVDPFGMPTSMTTVVDRGYVATTLPDGSIAFVATVELGVTVVHAVPSGGGWTVDRWEATGC